MISKNALLTLGCLFSGLSLSCGQPVTSVTSANGGTTSNDSLAIIDNKNMVEPSYGTVESLESSIGAAINKISPSTISIVANSTKEKGYSVGSGFIWDAAGHIITNSHVVAETSMIAVFFADGTSKKATVIGKDEQRDIAVIKVDSLASGSVPATLADSTKVQIGQFVIAFGTPFALQQSATLGIISQIRKKTDKDGKILIESLVQTDAAVNPGNSGGPLINLHGEVVGINTFGYGPDQGEGADTGVNFAVGISVLKEWVPKLMK